jgi:hypothetical protein
MHAKLRLATVVVLTALAACAEHDPSAPADVPNAAPKAAAPTPDAPVEALRLERQARRLALSLADPDNRQYLRTQLGASPFREHKLSFQRFLAQDGERTLGAMARAAGEAESAVRIDASQGLAAEVYFPVPGQQEAWDGGPDLLVATALHDHDAPVAFDTRGRRILLDPDRPPSTPVLALVPKETDFDHPPGRSNAICQIDDCGGGTGGGGAGGGGTGGSGTPTGTSPAQALYLTRAQFSGTFEGWLKGNPEFELHVLGPASPADTTNLISYQCVGEHAPTGYYWDMNSTSWSGTAKVFTQAQMDALESAYPGHSYMIMALEDDDTACEIKMDRDLVGNTFEALKSAYQAYVALKDIKVITINGATRILVAAKSGAHLISSLASLIKTNDDLIGIAVADSVIGRTSSVGHWAVLNGYKTINGWLNLEVK